ncbi:12752_t:CDS:2 [Funneliformis mosseae]|uniref:Large ribosomal subunit protein uL3m n=1 Tax=Funneliformis mosseae TaxID=27381 RepID=A0A9N8W9L4_FUNMO|nr:12752_t:CDS:2 [Funneliformis mosseae]
MLSSKLKPNTFILNLIKLNKSAFNRNFSSIRDTNPSHESTETLTKEPKWTNNSIRIGAIARKKGMSALWDEWGVRHPVTILQLEQVQVVQIKENQKRIRPPLVAVQVGCSEGKNRFKKPLLGHFENAGVNPKAKLLEFHITPDAVVPVGTEIKAAHFVPGQYVDVTAPSIGKGFAGVMKRWNFKGLPASHGTSLAHRSAGSTGQNQDPGRVFKGKKMAGRLGGQSATVLNLKVLKIDNYLNLIYIKGSVPGFDNQFVRIRDAIKKHGKKCFPSDCIPPPFPTINPEIVKTMPRELMAKTGGVDPFIPKEV